MSDDATVRRPVPMVRLFVRNERGRVLLLKRASTSHAPDAWCLPGGKVDYGETVEDAVAKELHEETSLRCRSATFCFYQDSLPPEPGAMHGINLYFECDAVGEIKLNRESSRAAWVGPEDSERYEIAFRNRSGLRRYWASRGQVLGMD